jgi:hypothetical protein
MSFLKFTILFGVILTLMPMLISEQGAFAHGTAHQDEATVDPTVDPTAVPQDIDTINVTVTETSEAHVVGVKPGTQVNLSVHGVEAKELHLHGYDIEFKGEPALGSFIAAHTGRFALEMHIVDDLLGKRARAVLYIEVRE